MLSWQMIDQQTFTRARRRPGNPAGRRRAYVEQIGAFDIETSIVRTREILGVRNNTTIRENGELKHLGPRTEIDIVPHSIMYIWMYAIDDAVYYGRTWQEFEQFILHLERRLPTGYKLLTYVHNLSYEYQFLAGIKKFANEDIFATDARKILKLDYSEGVEMRCSYFLSNRSLREFLRAEGVEAQKGEMDYKKLRFPWTPLDAEELYYCEHDVLGLTQAIRHRLAMTGDSVYTIPYTSTGYVRREAKRVLKAGRRHDAYKRDGYGVYVRLRRAFRGGNTHASRYWVALGVIRDDTYGDDFSSFYPSSICQDLFPAAPFTVEDPVIWHREGDAQHIKNLLEEHRAVLMTITLYGVQVDDFQHVPYIPVDKCEELDTAAIDNGRVLRADLLTITITDVDFKVIAGMYKWEDLRLSWCAYTSYAPLPAEYIELTREYFRRKTELKGKNDYDYARSKELLNALYGMMAMDPLRMVIELDATGVLIERKPDDMKKAYEEGVKKAFMPYSWGVWLTAHCRARLQQAIDACGDDFLYCDTDSVKHLTDDLGLATLFAGDTYEAVDAQGKTHRMGVMERDTHYTEFVSLGAKKYACRYADDMGKKAGKLEITVAGVGKVEGSAELEAKGGIDAFKPGLVFRSGSIDAVYNDMDSMSYLVGRHHLEVTRNVALIDGIYTLGISRAYKDLLDDLREPREIINPFEDLPLE